MKIRIHEIKLDTLIVRYRMRDMIDWPLAAAVKEGRAIARPERFVDFTQILGPPPDQPSSPGAPG